MSTKFTFGSAMSAGLRRVGDLPRIWLITLLHLAVLSTLLSPYLLFQLKDGVRGPALYAIAGAQAALNLTLLLFGAALIRLSFRRRSTGLAALASGGLKIGMPELWYTVAAVMRSMVATGAVFAFALTGWIVGIFLVPGLSGRPPSVDWSALPAAGPYFLGVVAVGLLGALVFAIRTSTAEADAIRKSRGSLGLSASAGKFWTLAFAHLLAAIPGSGLIVAIFAGLSGTLYEQPSPVGAGAFVVVIGVAFALVGQAFLAGVVCHAVETTPDPDRPPRLNLEAI